jgi:flagellar FliL protein
MTDAPQPAAPAKAAAVPAAKKSGSKMLVIIIAGVVVIAGGAGGWLWHMRSAKAQAQQTERADAPPKTEVKSVLHLESFIVNLQGGSGTSYLRIGIDLGLAGEAKEGEKEAAPTGRLRDSILTVLGAQSVDALLTLEGKEKLKADILKSINDRVPEIDCKEVYFTEFLVQQ